MKKLLTTLTACLMIAGCAGPTAATSDHEACLGMAKSKTLAEAERYAAAALSRGLKCDGDYTNQLTPEEQANQLRLMEQLLARYGHLLK